MANQLIPDDYLLQNEPVDFIELAFDDSLRDKQQEVARSILDHTYTVVRSCHGPGKSFVAAAIALWFLYAFPNSKVITTAPTFRHVEDVLWREIRSAKRQARIPLGGKVNQTDIDIAEEWFAKGLSTGDPERFSGYHAIDILLIVDEASGVTEDIFNASEGIVNSKHARVLYIGNPTSSSGTVYNAFKLPGYSKIHISAFDTPNFTAFGITPEDIRDNTWEAKITGELPRPYLITPEWVYDKYLRWGEGTPMWDSRVTGNFPTEGEDTLIPLHYIEAAARRSLVPQEDDPLRIGCDIARYGSDKTAIALRRGPKLLEMKVYSCADTMTTAQRIADYAALYPTAEVAVDEVGVGAGVYDRLKTLLPGSTRLYGVNVGRQAFKPEKYANLRAAIYWALRERFVAGDIDLSSLPPDQLDEISGQLSSIRYDYTNKQQIRIEKKDDMKKRGLPSPDMGDALAIARGRLRGNVQFFAMPLPTPQSVTAPVAPAAAAAAPMPANTATPVARMPEAERKKAELEADLAAIRSQRGW